MAKLVVLVVLALIAGSVQCAAACTPVSCCHHHKQAPKADCHELVPATTVLWFAVGSFSAEPVNASPISEPGIQTAHDASPPVQAIPPLTVLRI